MNSKIISFFIVITFFFQACTSDKNQQENCIIKDVLFINGHIITLNANNDIVDAIRIRGNKIIAVGDADKTFVRSLSFSCQKTRR